MLIGIVPSEIVVESLDEAAALSQTAHVFSYWDGPGAEEHPFRLEWNKTPFKVTLYNDEVVLPILAGYGEQYVSLYKRIRIPACKSDLARLLLVRQFGGLYIDAHCGLGNVASLVHLFAQLAAAEVVLVDVTTLHKGPGDIHILNSIICARARSELLDVLIRRVLENLGRQAETEELAKAHAPYNIYTITGPAVLTTVLFDRSKSPILLHPDYRQRVKVLPFGAMRADHALVRYAHNSYRRPGQHWSERQNREPLFDPASPLRSSRISPFNISQVKSDADALNHQKKYADALAVLLPAIEFALEDHWLNFHVGRAYSGLGDRVNATKYFLAAAASKYPFRIGALFEIVKHDLSVADFSRTELLDTALDLPGEIMGKDEASTQKRVYYFQIQFLRSMLLLRSGQLEACNELLEQAYSFSLMHDERPFAFDWVIDILEELPNCSHLPNIEYLRQRLLNQGPPISYGQLLSKIPDDAFVLEIGGMDGVRFDPLRRYLVSRPWKAVVVEPLPDMFALLKENYAGFPAVQCVNVAIAEESGQLSMYRIRPDDVAAKGGGDWLIGISSAFKGPALAYHNDVLSEEVVRALSFQDFVAEFGITKIDVLQIDTGGYDWRILSQIDLTVWEINLIHIEIINLKPTDRMKVFAALRTAGYRYFYDGMDVTALRQQM